jgi:hypothetical protein
VCLQVTVCMRKLRVLVVIRSVKTTAPPRVISYPPAPAPVASEHGAAHVRIGHVAVVIPHIHIAAASVTARASPGQPKPETALVWSTKHCWWA